MGVKVVRKANTQFWYVRICHAGKRTSRLVANKPLTKAQQARIQNKYEMKLAMGEIDFHNGKSKNAPPESGSFVKDYLETAKKRLKHATYEGYRIVINKHLVPSWRHRSLDSISKADIRELLIRKQDKEKRSIGNIKVAISAIFQYAVEQDILKTNPCRSLGKIAPTSQKATKELQVLTAKQIELLLSAAGELHDFLLTAFRTGARLAELLGLCWDSVNFATKQICIKRTFNHHHWDTAKTHKIRYVDMSAELEKTLRKRFDERTKQICQTGTDEQVELVFPDATGNPMDSDKLRRRFYKLLKATGLPRIRIHDIRHTTASLLLSMGTPMIFVSRLLGHSNIATTVNLYGHVAPGQAREFLDKLDK